ncbi:CDP-diacylglycerol diphosphatase [Polynucleobacter sp. MWH-Berg-3C6]|nr:CDP-diacylglycerol diphosphatase [Polynucleobacter sp. MWH-Berg-3C6]
MFKAVFVITVSIGISSQAIALNIAKSDILLHIVSQCVDPLKENYCANCTLPRREANCGNVSECKKTNEVWALNTQYAAIRDIKMCGCPAEFVHGLAIPRDLITGVEDLNRQEDIWQFAWDVGVERIEAESLALVVNPKSQRTQNQLHLHILRLDQNARARFEQYAPVYVDNLKSVWLIADKDAKAKGLRDYGVLVAQTLEGKYLVLVSPNSPEAAFTIWSCN